MRGVIVSAAIAVGWFLALTPSFGQGFTVGGPISGTCPSGNFIYSKSGTIGCMAPAAINVTYFGASGSAQTTTGTIAASTVTLTLSSALDFVNGEGVMIPGAGATFSAGAPSATASVVGTPGSATVYYEVASLDGAGGVGLPVQTHVTTGVATLTAQNYIQIAITAGSGATAYAVWKGSSSGGPWTYIGSGQAATYNDTGFANPNRPWWIPASAPTAAQNDWLVATISSGGGTTSLTLSTHATNPVSGVTIYHDDTAAINVALNQSAGARVEMPCGTYGVSSSINWTQNYVGLFGDRFCTTINASGVADDFRLIGTSSAYVYGGIISGLILSDYGKAAGYAVNAQYVERLDLENLIVNQAYSGIYLYDFNDVRERNVVMPKIWSQQGVCMQWQSGPSAASNAFDGTYFYCNSYGGSGGDEGTGQYAFKIDGNVDTIVARNFGASNISGEGLVVSNAIGASSPPAFVQFTDLGVEYMVGKGVDLEAGLKLSFTQGFIHSAGYNNFVSCASSADLYVAATASASAGPLYWNWNGGSISGAAGDGIYADGEQGVIDAASVIWNSNPNGGGTIGACPGIEFGGSSRYVSLGVSSIGDVAHPTWQSEPILLDSSASDLAIGFNTFAGNVSNTVVDNSGQISNQIGFNAGDSSPGFAFDNVHGVFGVGPNATYANLGYPGIIVSNANNGSSVRIEVANTGTGNASSSVETATTATTNAYSILSMQNNGGSPYYNQGIGAGVTGGATFDASGGGTGVKAIVKAGSAAQVTANPVLQLVGSYTVSTLPTCSSGLTGTIAYVTDASSPTYNGTLTGGSSTKTLAMCNGSAWTAH